MSSLNPIFDELEHGILDTAHTVEGWFHKPPAQPDVTATQEDHMSLFDTIENGLAEVKVKFEGIAEEDLALLKRVQANPETAVILRDLDALAVVAGIPQGFISGVSNGLKVLLAAYTPAPAAQ